MAWLPTVAKRLLGVSPSRVRYLSILTSPPTRAVLYDHHGPPEQVVRVAAAEIGDRDVCVRMLAPPLTRPPSPRGSHAGYEGVH
uniref:Uncharacterized protein n=1 Tax=Oryza brachyantha TaxID=4533 RepID=J3NAJ4_ORYBR